MNLDTLISDPVWRQHLSTTLNTEKSLELMSFLEAEYNSETVFPPKEEVFTALNLTPFEKVKVVIFGQDPYHGPGQAHGLAFSVKPPCPPPPSLKNIFKEAGVETDQGDLTPWAEQGVLLLNTVLTVKQGKPNSHSKKGWEEITNAIIELLSAKKENLIFVLWGAPAQKKKALIDNERHEILESVHPSPLSAYRGFLGCGHFKKINDLLVAQGKEPVDWQISSLNPIQPELF